MVIPSHFPILSDDPWNSSTEIPTFLIIMPAHITLPFHSPRITLDFEQKEPIISQMTEVEAEQI